MPGEVTVPSGAQAAVRLAYELPLLPPAGPPPQPLPPPPPPPLQHGEGPLDEPGLIADPRVVQAAQHSEVPAAGSRAGRQPRLCLRRCPLQWPSTSTSAGVTASCSGGGGAGCT